MSTTNEHDKRRWEFWVEKTPVDHNVHIACDIKPKLDKWQEAHMVYVREVRKGEITLTRDELRRAFNKVSVGVQGSMSNAVEDYAALEAELFSEGQSLNERVEDGSSNSKPPWPKGVLR